MLSLCPGKQEPVSGKTMAKKSSDPQDLKRGVLWCIFFRFPPGPWCSIFKKAQEKIQTV
jgi:hypothetical protein